MTVLPVNSTNNECGCGFFLNHFFITSGHVISKCENPYIFVRGVRIPLVNPIFYEDNESNSFGYDLAIFILPVDIIGLELFDEDVTTGMVLESISFKAQGTERVNSNVVVNDFREGNYFGGLTDYNLKSGSSGSPVLLGGRVVGVMTKGNNNDFDKPRILELPINFCVFLSSEAIKSLLTTLLSSEVS